MLQRMQGRGDDGGIQRHHQERQRDHDEDGHARHPACSGGSSRTLFFFFQHSASVPEHQ